jgi:polar amino acid transport system substrate-binding protein
MLAIVIFSALILHAPAGHAESLKLVTESYPPYNFAEGDKVTGLTTEILTAAAKKANVTISISLVPWARALSLAESEPATCVYSTIRIPEREKSYKWIGPVIEDGLGLFALAEKKIHLEKIEDARKFKVGTYIGSVANGYLHEHGIDPDLAPSDTLNLDKLRLGRIDLWVASRRNEAYVSRHDPRAIVLQTAFVFPKEWETQMYLACSKQVPDDLVERLNSAIKQLKADGTIAKISRRYPFTLK